MNDEFSGLLIFFWVLFFVCCSRCHWLSHFAGNVAIQCQPIVEPIGMPPQHTAAKNCIENEKMFCNVCVPNAYETSKRKTESSKSTPSICVALFRLYKLSMVVENDLCKRTTSATNNKWLQRSTVHNPRSVGVHAPAVVGTPYLVLRTETPQLALCNAFGSEITLLQQPLQEWREKKTQSQKKKKKEKNSEWS